MTSLLRCSVARRLPSLRRYIQTTQPTITKPNVPDAPNVSKTNEQPVGFGEYTIFEDVKTGEELRVQQAPNRDVTWSKSQRPRSLGMTGPRFEQTILEAQPAPWAAIELIHKQPVRWSKERVVACDGGGGPMGHPKVFINVDKPIVEPCGYCGLPFAHEKNREVIAKNGTDYSLE